VALYILELKLLKSYIVLGTCTQTELKLPN